MNEKFRLLNDSIKTSKYILSIVDNISNKEVILKRNIEASLYDLVEELFRFNIESSNKIKGKWLKEYLFDLSKIDYYLNIFYSKKYIKKKKLLSCTKYLSGLRSMCYSLLNNIYDKV